MFSKNFCNTQAHSEQWHNIPAELKHLSQWCVAGTDKAPYYLNQTQLMRASVTAPSTWMSFETACQVAQQNNLGIGFVLTEQDVFSCIDLDVVDVGSQKAKSQEVDPSKWTTPEQMHRYQIIINQFDSYAEYSRSGKGVHIWVKGKIGKGCRRDGVEIYSQERFIIFTGSTMLDQPIAERQELLDCLVAEIRNQQSGSTQTQELVEIAPNENDEAIWQRARNADNAEKFIALCEGRWKELNYPSQSEADMALISMIAFYTNSNDQCRRMFRMTELGKRDKANKNDRYLNGILRVVRARHKLEQDQQNSIQIAPSFFTGHNTMNQYVKDIKNKQQNDFESKSLSWPPGFCGAVAQYIYNSSHRPVQEVSIVAALGLLAGICGKAWQTPTDTGLNLYIILVARSAIGKEAMHTGISQLMSYVRQGEPSLEKASHFVNFNDFASGQALQKAIVDHQSFVNVAGEFGLRLQQIAKSSTRAESPMQNLRRIVTNMYSKSGQTSVAAGINYSDKEKNIGSVHGAAYSLIGETTPGVFYGLLDFDMMSDGFLSRFSIVEYLGDRPPENQMASKFAIPAPELLNHLRDLVRQALSLITQNKCTIVECDLEADQMLKLFNEESDNAIIAAGDDESKRQTWNRAHLKVLKIASIFAVVDNPMFPKITTLYVQWAIEFVRRDIHAFMKRLESGDIGAGDEVREQKLLSIIKEYLFEEYLPKYAQCFEPLRKDGIIPRKYLQQRTQKVACFSGHRLGATKALNETIHSLIDVGHLIEYKKDEISNKYNYYGQSYSLISTEEFKLKK